ncbi:MAG: PDZ domain-containing protein [Pedobacter sp.]|nr:MAG: PDZ domain-containing protein [Pedobacter sp.]
MAAFIGGAAAIGGYKLLEPKNEQLSFAEQQNVLFANNPKISSAGAVDFVGAAAAVSPAVVHIKTSYGSSKPSGQRGGSPMDMFEEFFGGGGRRMQQAPRAASGSGVILTPDGYIVTNNHVVENADKIEVVLSDRRKVSATVIGKDPNTDLALIKVDATNLPVVKMGNSDNVQIGEWVLAVGFPLDLQTTVTAGIVSAKARSIGILARSQQPTEEEYEEYQRTGKIPAPTSIESFIQTDAAINPGNSGGAKKILDDFRKYGSVKRGYVGVTFAALDADRAEELKVNDITGLYVTDVLPNSGAAAAGLKKGDIIKKVEGATIYDSPDLQEKIGRLSPGDKVQLTYLRDGQLKNVNVTLKGESSIKDDDSAVASTSGARVEKLGASFAPAPAALKTKYGVKNGVVITNVEQGKTFDSFRDPKGLLITSVNGKSVNNAADVKAAVAGSANGTTTISGVTAQGTFSYTF